MRTLNQWLLIKAEWPEEVIRHGNIELLGSADALLYPEKYKPIKGKVLSPPKRTRQFYCDHDIQEGDTVYFHYHATDDKMSVEKDEFMIDFCWVYFWERDGKVHMAREWCLIEPVLDEAENYFRPSGLLIVSKNVHVEMKNGQPQVTPKRKKLQGIVRYLPEHNLDPDFVPGAVNVGDFVQMDDTSDVNFTYNGKEYYRTRYSELLCIYGKREETQDLPAAG